jgi:hypothetical protein
VKSSSETKGSGRSQEFFGILGLRDHLPGSGPRDLGLGFAKIQNTQWPCVTRLKSAKVIEMHRLQRNEEKRLGKPSNGLSVSWPFSEESDILESISIPKIEENHIATFGYLRHFRAA